MSVDVMTTAAPQASQWGMVRMEVALSEIFTIPEGWQHHVVGSFIVNGVKVVNGVSYIVGGN